MNSVCEQAGPRHCRGFLFVLYRDNIIIIRYSVIEILTDLGVPVYFNPSGRDDNIVDIDFNVMELSSTNKSNGVEWSSRCEHGLKDAREHHLKRWLRHDTQAMRENGTTIPDPSQEGVEETHADCSRPASL